MTLRACVTPRGLLLGTRWYPRGASKGTDDDAHTSRHALTLEASTSGGREGGGELPPPSAKQSGTDLQRGAAPSPLVVNPATTSPPRSTAYASRLLDAATPVGFSDFPRRCRSPPLAVLSLPSAQHTVNRHHWWGVRCPTSSALLQDQMAKLREAGKSLQEDR